MRNLNLIQRPIEGEELYKKRWQKLYRFVDPIYYRLFSVYCGKDINILPVDISRNIIEPLLNPPLLRSYYLDKNMYDKIFPPQYTPKTILRKIKGFYYTSNYILFKELTDCKLSDLLISYKKIIIKPSIETGHGKGVLLFEKNNNSIFINYTNKKEELSLELLKKHYESDFIIQEYLIQSPSMSQFNPTSVNTFRVVVYKSIITNELISFIQF